MPSRSRTRSSARSNSTARARSWPSALLVLALAGGGCATAGPATETVRVDASQAWQLVGFSAEGRQLLATAFGPADAPRLYVVGGIHGDESEGRIALQPLVREWTDAPVRVRVLADANPDGSAANTRTNAHGIDLNRNWPALNWSASAYHPLSGAVSGGTAPLSEPETEALWTYILKTRPAAVLVLHCCGAVVEGNDGLKADALAAAYANRGRVYDLMGDYQKALDDYIAALNTDEETVTPDVIHKLLYSTGKTSSVRKRAQYIYEQLQLPEDERIMRIPELDDQQFMYKP